MKLFTKYSRINVLATIAIFLFASAAYYYVLHYILINQIDEDLKIEENEIRGYVNEHHLLPENVSVQDQFIIYTLVQQPYTYRSFATTNMIDPKEKEREPFRQLTFGIAANHQWYRVVVSKSLEETENLTRSILLVTLFTILLILITSLIINRVVLKRIWKPFYHTLSSVQRFKVGNQYAVDFPATPIEEFDFMNQTLKRIIQQAQVDYLALKNFSENASHEIQTPLAVIRSKLDLLIQDESLTGQQSSTLQSAYDAVQKLSKLNQSLLLLAKIENKQYEAVQEVFLKRKVEQKISDFQELWQAQQITVTYHLDDAVVYMNEELADILLNNLFSNATRHNFSGGHIAIELNKNKLAISNTSRQPAAPPDKLFQRFYKTASGREHNGLGLSIIKQIGEASGLAIAYRFQNNQHLFTISW